MCSTGIELRHQEAVVTCSICTEAKPGSDFGKDKSRKNGLAVRCKVCMNKTNRRWREANREKSRSSRDRWSERNREHIREKYYRRTYGIGVDDVARMLLEQDSACAICTRRDPVVSTGGFHVDHDHRTGQVRALLCGRCNIAIGLLDDSPERAEALAAYLRKHSESQP